jgi:hypothetical protein
MAGVEHDQISILALWRSGQALLAQHFAHTLAIIDVHLTAEAFDPVGLRRRSRFHALKMRLAVLTGVFNKKGGAAGRPSLSAGKTALS